jgi:acyl carrier protein
MESLLSELRHKIVTLLNLPDIAPESIDPDEQLVGGRLGIDSIDVLEMVMMMEKDYGIVIDNKEMGAKVFSSLRSMSRYILEKSDSPAN